jgi:GMP synthase (glutamine-hydrolysing)
VRVLCVVHQEDAGPGVFADVARERGDELVEWMPPSGRPPPEPFDALLVMGGGMHVDQEDEHSWLAGEKRLLREVLGAGVPALGVCLGSQLVAEACGARVGPAARPEIGWREVELSAAAVGDPLLGRLPARFPAFEWHSYAFELPPGAVELARNDLCLQAFRAGDSSWGVQFHAEVTREAAASWLRRYSGGSDVRSAGVDLEAVARENERRISGWNELGRAIFGRFVERAGAS